MRRKINEGLMLPKQISFIVWDGEKYNIDYDEFINNLNKNLKKTWYFAELYLHEADDDTIYGVVTIPLSDKNEADNIESIILSSFPAKYQSDISISANFMEPSDDPDDIQFEPLDHYDIAIMFEKPFNYITNSKTINEGLMLPYKKLPSFLVDKGDYYEFWYYVFNRVISPILDNELAAELGSYFEIIDEENIIYGAVYVYSDYPDLDPSDEMINKTQKAIKDILRDLFPKNIVLDIGVYYNDTEENSRLYDCTISLNKPVEIIEDRPTNINEGIMKCTIENVEKKAKEIVFVKYNWNPKNVVFTTDKDVVQIMATDDLKPELQQASDETILTFLQTLSTKYTKDINKKFNGFCGGLSLFSTLMTDISSSVYCYTIIEKQNQTYFYSSNGEKKQLKHGKHPQYTTNKLYFKIGLFASNVKSSKK